MIVYAIAAGSLKRSSGAPDAAEALRTGDERPELMTGNMLGRSPDSRARRAIRTRT